MYEALHGAAMPILNMEDTNDYLELAFRRRRHAWPL